MSFNFENVDTSDFVCIQLKDSSIYYGQVLWVDEHGNFVDAPADPSAVPNVRRVRNGIGVQIYPNVGEDDICRYEGYWDMDQMNGIGKCTYPDKSIYNGNLRNGVKDGYGKFIWPNGDTYDGNWKDGRIEGGGKFIHHDGNVLSGMFKNGCYHLSDDTYINPFLSKQEIDTILRRKKDIALAKEMTKKEKLFIFEKAEDYERAAELIKKSNLNKRVPVIIASRESYKGKDDFYENIAPAMNKKIFEFDLRKAAEFKPHEEKFRKYMNGVKKSLAEALMTDQIFCINIDDTDIHYEEIYDPDLREIYDANTFPSQILNLEELSKPEVKNKVAVDTEFRTHMKTNNEYNIVIWSKFKVDSTLEAKKIIEKFERRFSSILPTLKLDLIMLL